MSGSSADDVLIKANVPIMCNSSYFFSKVSNLFSINNKYVKAAKKKGIPIFLDSGGYSFLMKNIDYPFSIYQYSAFIKKLKPNYAATMDYACEPLLIKNSTIKNIKTRIQKTVENTDALVNNYNINKYTTLIPVVQGYEYDEYKYCINMYHKKDLLDNYIAIGSMCKRTNKEGKQLLLKIIRYLKRFIDAKIHVFGLKLSFLKDKDIFFSIYSVDTAAWTHNYQNRWGKGRNFKKYAANNEELKKNFFVFKSKIDKLFKEMKYQTTLEL